MPCVTRGAVHGRFNDIFADGATALAEGLRHVPGLLHLRLAYVTYARTRAREHTHSIFCFYKENEVRLAFRSNWLRLIEECVPAHKVARANIFPQLLPRLAGG